MILVCALLLVETPLYRLEMLSLQSSVVALLVHDVLSIVFLHHSKSVHSKIYVFDSKCRKIFGLKLKIKDLEVFEIYHLLYLLIYFICPNWTFELPFSNEILDKTKITFSYGRTKRVINSCLLGHWMNVA